MPHATFQTPLGICAIAWNENGLTRFLLPDPDRPPGAGAVETPSWIGQIVDRVQRHLAGDPQDFANVLYDFTKVPEFVRSVLQATLDIKPGRTTTYGELAAAIGLGPSAARAIGSALGANPWPLLIPCHRVIAATGGMTGFSGPGGIGMKVKLLALEGAQLLAE